jgi:hypothetical protein
VLLIMVSLWALVMSRELVLVWLQLSESELKQRVKLDSALSLGLRQPSESLLLEDQSEILLGKLV